MTGAGPGGIRATYERQAESWDRDRSRALFEAGWLERATLGLGPGAAILDLGCGSGAPIAQWLDERGYAVTGVDFAAPMLEIARARMPHAEWILADMRALDLGRCFAAIVAWDSFFHLAREDQRAMFAVFARHLQPGGRLLMSTGPRDGEAIGSVGGEPVYHASLSPEGYRAAMAAAGLRPLAFVPEDPDCAGHSVWLAEMLAPAGQRG